MNKDGLTPLLIASWKGHERVVKMLLEREDVSPNTADNIGGTPRRKPLSSELLLGVDTKES